MLAPEPSVLLCRQGFADAQAAQLAVATPLGFYQTGWYGTDTDDEVGSFAIVNAAGPLLMNVGDFLRLDYEGRLAFVYVIGSKPNLLTGVGDGDPLDIALTRRAYLALECLAIEPILARVAVCQ